MYIKPRLSRTPFLRQKASYFEYKSHAKEKPTGTHDMALYLQLTCSSLITFSLTFRFFSRYILLALARGHSLTAKHSRGLDDGLHPQNY